VLRVSTLFRLGASGGAGSPYANLGPPNIPETTTARKLKLTTQIVKYSLWVQKKVSARGQYNMRVAAILTFDKCLYLRGRQQLTTARRLSAYMSSRALATTTTSIYFWGRKINLSGISPAKRSRSGPNSLYVDTWRGNNAQGILGVIRPFWAQWGLGRVFLRGNPEDLSSTSQRLTFTKFGHET